MGGAAEALGKLAIPITVIYESTIGAKPFGIDDARAIPKPKPNCNSGRQTKCTLMGFDKILRGCIYTCDDGTLWYQAGPCPAFIYRDWGTGVPNR